MGKYTSKLPNVGVIQTNILASIGYTRTDNRTCTRRASKIIHTNLNIYICILPLNPIALLECPHPSLELLQIE